MVWNVKVKSASKSASKSVIWNVTEKVANRGAVNLKDKAAARFIVQLQLVRANASRIVKTKSLNAPKL